MSYPGNSSLSEDIRQRVLGTFRQTVGLAEQGKREEALLGCEFILRLDPDFELARTLQERVQGGAGEVETADLLALLDSAPAPAPPEVDLATELAELIERRELRLAVKLVQENAKRVASDPELLRLARSAQERLEAQPYVQSFIERAGKLRQEGRPAEAEAELIKARELDPTHPEIASLSLPQSPAAKPSAPARPAESRDTGTPADRIERLLAEGQEAFDAQRYQDAIDSWSRIFLIDIDHGEANRRIEEARRLKAEDERRVEELYHEALSLWELGNTVKARKTFQRVLDQDPHHLAAREHIERIDRGETPETPGDVAPAAEAPTAEAETDVLTEPEAPSLTPTTLRRSAPRREARPEAAPPPPARRFPGLPRPAFWIIGAIVLLGVLAAAWMLYSRRDGLFPNSGAKTEAADVLAAAQALQEQGETAKAIARLRAVPPSHPQHAEAQALIAQWETLLEDTDKGPSEEDLAQRSDLIRRARAAAAEDRHLAAVDLLKEAAAIAPLEPAEVDLAALSQKELEGLGHAIDRFRQGDWEFALPDLWRAHEANPDNPTVRRLIVDSYYNLAVRDLQRSDVDPAGEKLGEAAGLDPDDPEIQRLLRFVEAYHGRETDLRYRIFVKYLPFR